MAFASFDKQRGAAPVAEINMVPLIDVMLVLLVIFIVTAPLLTRSVPLELPRTGAPVRPPAVPTIDFSIDAHGQRYWNGERIERDEAARRFVQTGATQPQTEIRLHADADSAYRDVAQTLADAAHAGLTRIGFVSHPDAR